MGWTLIYSLSIKSYSYQTHQHKLHKFVTTQLELANPTFHTSWIYCWEQRSSGTNRIQLEAKHPILQNSQNWIDCYVQIEEH